MDRTLVESVFDKAALLDRFGGDRPSACRAVQTYLEELPWLVAAIRQAQQTADPRAFAKTLAGLKDVLGNLFAHTAYELAQRLETLSPAHDPIAAQQVIEALEGQTRTLMKHLEALRDELQAEGSPAAASG